MQSKGILESVQNLALVILVLAIAVVGSFIGKLILDEFNTQFTNLGSENTQINESVDLIHDGRRATNVFINSIPVLVFFAGVAIIMSTLVINVNPAFVPISIIAILVYGIISVIYANVLWDFVSSSAITDLANEHTLTVNVIRYFPFIMLSISVISFIVMFAVGRGQSV